jgi:hypothetical protein
MEAETNIPLAVVETWLDLENYLEFSLEEPCYSRY